KKKRRVPLENLFDLTVGRPAGFANFSIFANSRPSSTFIDQKLIRQTRGTLENAEGRPLKKRRQGGHFPRWTGFLPESVDLWR
ncbi:hypothetical protein L4664_006411, partial [Pseudomonas aeruginosa]